MKTAAYIHKVLCLFVPYRGHLFLDVSMACCAVYCHGGICCHFYYEDGPIFLVMCCVISCFFFVNTLSSKFLNCAHLREKVSHFSKQN